MAEISDSWEMGVRRFGRWNHLGLATLIKREVMRFMAVWTQTLLAPLITAGLFLAIFALAIGPGRGDVMGVPYVIFLAPGILAMNVIQNAFANTSSSIMVAKVQGNIVDILMPPLSPLELVLGFTVGAVVRALFTGVAIWAMMALFVGLGAPHPLVALLFVVLGSAFLGGLGMIAGIYAQKFDQMAAVTNFVITPLSFLSGTFYSLDALPPVMRVLSHANPIFYLIDGVRFGLIGQSDSSPVLGAIVLSVATFAILAVCWAMFRNGARLKP